MLVRRFVILRRQSPKPKEMGLRGPGKYWGVDNTRIATWVSTFSNNIFADLHKHPCIPIPQSLALASLQSDISTWI